MALPVFYIEFGRKHDRPPRPEELTLEQRSQLLDCCLANRESARRIAAVKQSMAAVADDPSLWHEAMREVGEPMRTKVMRMIMDEGPDAVLERARSRVPEGPGPDHWDRVIRESVGLL